MLSILYKSGRHKYSILGAMLGMTLSVGCAGAVESTARIRVDYTLERDHTHNRFSAAIEPVIRVPSGSVIEAYTHEATGGHFRLGSNVEALAEVEMSHALTGPVYVEGAEPGDRVSVELLEIEPGSWGWMAHVPNFGLLEGDFDATVLKTFKLDNEKNVVEFSDGIEVPLRPFAGVMGVAPDTKEMLSTLPPRANGGNFDDPNMVVGTTVHFPVFVPGALFSIGDTHAVQGMGEVSGTAMESPMRVVYRITLVKGKRPIEEPQYETDKYYATTGFASTLDEAARKATRYMIDHIVERKGLDRIDAYMLCSLVCDLKIAVAASEQNRLVTVHVPKSILEE